ncbi:Uncharacterised protein [Vibrio cholerae]|nr:Uncharacterised protein [Vibrio cholerae]CSD95203.1 Uncharacterised protein [Vibrio cholerae]
MQDLVGLGLMAMMPVITHRLWLFEQHDVG